MEGRTEITETNGEIQTSTVNIDQDLPSDDAVKEVFLPGYSQDEHRPSNEALLHTFTNIDDGQLSTNNTTPAGAMAVRFEEMLLEVINPTTIHVNWCLCRMKLLHGYKIRYTAKDTSSYNEIFVTSGITNYTLSGLRPNTEYVFCVNAVDDKENVIENCGWGSQRTEELDDLNQQSPPYFAVIVGIILLITAVVVPFCILVMAYCSHKHDFDAPYLTAVAAITLLLIAVLVPITFLLLRSCGQCSFTSDHLENPDIVLEKSEDPTTTMSSPIDLQEPTLDFRNIRTGRLTKDLLEKVAQVNKTGGNPFRFT